MTDFGADQVECYSGHTYAQEPRTVVWHGRRYPVSAVDPRWRTPEGPAFWVEAEAGERFEIHYEERTDTWTVQPFPAGDEPQRPSPSYPPVLHNDDKEVPIR